MKITKIYRYIGENGSIDTPILLNGISHIKRLRLKADKNKVLTDGNKTVKTIDIFAIDLENWSEIDEKVEGQK